MARPDDPPARRWLFDAAHPAPPLVNAAVTDHYLADEAQTLESLLDARNTSHRATGASARRGTLARRRHPQPPAGRERRRCAAARVRPVVGRRHRADVPGRGPAAHPRCGHGGPPHRRQARLRGLASACGGERLVVRQRFDLGAAIDGAHRAARRDRRGAGIVLRAARRARRRAGRPHRVAASDAHSRPAVRDGRDDRGGAAAQRGVARAQLFVRHAR